MILWCMRNNPLGLNITNPCGDLPAGEIRRTRSLMHKVQTPSPPTHFDAFENSPAVPAVLSPMLQLHLQTQHFLHVWGESPAPLQPERDMRSRGDPTRRKLYRSIKWHRINDIILQGVKFPVQVNDRATVKSDVCPNPN